MARDGVFVSELFTGYSHGDYVLKVKKVKRVTRLRRVTSWERWSVEELNR